VDVHPYRTLWQTHDLDAWANALDPGVVLRSPITSMPFTGRDAAIELFAVLLDSLSELEITDELTDGDTRAFCWRARAGADEQMEGVDIVRHGEQGKITEITVTIRPLAAIGTFAAAIGPPLAARRSREREAIARVMSVPLKALLAIPDAVVPRLVMRR